MAGALIRLDGPPTELVGVRIRVHFNTPTELRDALNQLRDIAPRRALLAVDYRPETLTEAAVAVHRAFAQQRPDWSTYVPLCTPEADPMIHAVATPSSCKDCLFYEAGRCQGMGKAAADWGHGSGPPALVPVDRPLSAWTRADFAADRPVAYWMPTHAQIATIAAGIDGPVWDVGGANGFFAMLLAAEGLDVTIIDPVDAYPTPPGVKRIVADVRTISAPPPDALFISWPPPGESFADVIARWQPNTLAYALDREGFCGRQSGYAEIDAFADRVEWRGFATTGPGIPSAPTQVWQVPCHHDLRRGGSPLGHLAVWSPAQPPESVTPYPWNA